LNQGDFGDLKGAGAQSAVIPKTFPLYLSKQKETLLNLLKIFNII